MKKMLLTLTLALSFGLGTQAQSSGAAAPKDAEIYLFFAFPCPPCFQTATYLDGLTPAQEGRRKFIPTPLSLGREDWVPYVRLYWTLESMGLSEKHHLAVFKKVHNDRVNMADINVRKVWLVEQGIDPVKFEQVWNARETSAKVMEGENRARKAGINRTPSFLLPDGQVVRYMGSPLATFQEVVRLTPGYNR